MIQQNGGGGGGGGGGGTPDDNSVSTAKIVNDAVTNAKLADAAANTLKGNATGSSDNPTDIAVAASRVVGRGPTGNIDDLTIGESLVITDTSISRAALTGDVTASADSNATSIANNAVTTAKIIDDAVTTAKILNTNVTLAKVANAAANDKLLGSGNAGSGASYAEITLGTGLTMDGTTLNAESGTIADGSVSTAKIVDDAVTNDKLADMAAQTVKVNATGSTAGPTDLAVSTSRIVGRGPTGNIDDLTVGAGLTISDTNIGRAALTGDVTASADSNATTIANNAVTTAKINNAAVTDAKLADATAQSLKGNPTGSSAAPTDLVIAASRIVGRGPTGNVDDLTVGAGLVISDTNIGRAALTGDVTASADSNATTIANNAVTTAKINNAAVTLAKLANAAANSKLIGSGSAGSGAAYEEITIGTGLTMTGTTLSSSGGSAAQSFFGMTYNSSLSSAGIGDGEIRFNNGTLSSATEAYISSNTNDPSAPPNIGAYLLTAKPGWYLDVFSLVDTSFGVFRITSVTSATGFRTFVLSGTTNSINLTPGEAVIIRLRADGNVQYNPTTGALEVAGADISGSLTYENLDDLPAAASGNEDYGVFVRSPAAQTDPNVLSFPWTLQSNGTQWNAAGGGGIFANLATEVKLVFANTGITWTASNNGGTVRVTASGAHGLTTGATHAGRQFVVKTTGSGWVQYDKHTISGISSTTAVELTTATGALAGTAPVFYLETEQTPMCWFVLPVLRARSEFYTDLLFSHSATTDSKRMIVTLGTAIHTVASGQEFLNINQTTAAAEGIFRFVSIKNRGSVSSQIGSTAKAVGTTASATIQAALPTATVDTSASTIVTVSCTMAVQDQFMDLLQAKSGLVY